MAGRKIGNFDPEAMRKAVLEVVDHGSTLRGAAKDFSLSYATLRHYVRKYNAADEDEKDSLKFSPNYEVNLVFSEELENDLVEYLIITRRLRYSLTSEDVRRLSYDLAVKHKLKIPFSWQTSCKAGKHWMYGFLNRRPKIKNMLNLSKKFRLKKSEIEDSKSNLNKDELIVDDHLEDFIESDEEEGVISDVTSKPVVIIPVKNLKS